MRSRLKISATNTQNKHPRVSDNVEVERESPHDRIVHSRELDG